MKATIGKTSEKFAADLIQLKKESANQIKRSFESITTLRDFIVETREDKKQKYYSVLSEKIDSAEKKLSGFEDALNSRVAKLIREYDKLKSSLEYLSKERDIYKTLYEFSIDITSAGDLKSVLKRMVKTTTEILACDYTTLQITGDDGEVIFKYDLSLKNGSSGKPKQIRQLAEAVLITGDPIRIESNDNSGNIICVPLKSGEGVLGFLLSVRYDSDFTSFDLELLKTISIESERMLSALEDYRESLIEDLRTKYDFDEIIGNSAAMTKILATVADVAETDSAVLIEGGSGTGKELLARALHKNSARRDEPFVAINCGAIPETLLESELFGFEKGAFTGAIGRKPGKFELADKGTIFLDEIGELSPFLQVKLLRFLQSHEFEPLGSTVLKRSDVRILSASKRDLKEMVGSGEFRDDLYYRINVIAINLPPLYKRQGDIEILANHFLNKYAQKNDKEIASINESAIGYLKNYTYPGNIRELENIIERAVVLCKGDALTPNELPETVKKCTFQYDVVPNTLKDLNDYKKELWEKTVIPLERNFAVNLLESSGGNISSAARMGGMHRKQLQRILSRTNIQMPSKTEKGS